MNKKNYRNEIYCFKILIFGILLPIVICGIIYYLFFPEVYFVKLIDKYIYLQIHLKPQIWSHEFLKLYRFYAFDLVWAFAFANTLFVLYSQRSFIFLNFIVPILFGGLFEILQKHKVIFGTADLFDVFIEIMGSLLATIIYLRFRRNDYAKF